MVKAFYTPTDKRLPASLAAIQKSVRDVQRPTGTEKSRSLLQIEDAIAALQDQQSRIEDAAKIYSASTGATHSAASWMPNPPMVSASSISRKFRVTVTGGSAMGTTFLTFSAPGYDRDRALGPSAAAILSRVAVLGGAGDPATGQRSWVVTMPGPGPYNFYAQARPTDQYASAIGLQIDVQPVL